MKNNAEAIELNEMELAVNCRNYLIFSKTLISANKKNSCKRRTCECDMAFFKAVSKLTLNPKMNNAKCVFPNLGGAGNGYGTCCKKSQLSIFYNSKTHDCCDNGEVASAGEC